MKRIVVFLFVVMAALAAKSQVYVGGNISLWHNDDADATSFTLAPEVGYEFSDQWSVGAQLILSHSKHKVDDHVKAKWTGFAFAPYARYSFSRIKRFVSLLTVVLVYHHRSIRVPILRQVLNWD